jgi:hypothetical protein
MSILPILITKSNKNLMSPRLYPVHSPKCRMIPVSAHTEFDDMDCPIEHLVKRDNGKKKGAAGTPKKRKKERDHSEAEDSLGEESG